MEAVLCPALLGSLPGPLRRSRADEKPWSATRPAGETHRADGDSASFWSLCKSLFSDSGQIWVHQRVDAELLWACVNWREKSRREESLGVSRSFQRNGRRGGVRSARRRDESTLDGHDLNDFVSARLNISRCVYFFWRWWKCRWCALRKKSKHPDCLHVSCRYFSPRGLLAELRISKEGASGPKWEPVTEQLRTMVKFHNSDLWIAWMVIFCMEGKLCGTLETCAPVLHLRADLTLRTDSPVIIMIKIILMIKFTGCGEHISKRLTALPSRA